MDDAQQNSQNLQSAPSTKSHGLQRPGMLVMGIVGIPLIGFGTYVMTRSVSKDAGLKNAFGAAFLVPGAAMSAIGVCGMVGAPVSSAVSDNRPVSAR